MGLGARRIGIEHRRDALQVVDPQVRDGGDVGERIPAHGLAALGERIEAIDGLALSLAVAGGDRPVLALDVDANERSRPVEAIWDHDADALARSRRSGKRQATERNCQNARVEEIYGV